MTLILISGGLGFILGVIGTTFAAKAGWITPSNVKPL